MTIDPDAFNAFEAAGWERSAAGYDEFFAPITGRVVETLLDVAEARSGTRLLDLATGPGYVAGRAVARGADVVGVDVSDAMLQIARRRISSARFERGDIEELSFADASFDAVVGNFGSSMWVGRSRSQQRRSAFSRTEAVSRSRRGPARACADLGRVRRRRCVGRGRPAGGHSRGPELLPVLGRRRVRSAAPGSEHRVGRRADAGVHARGPEPDAREGLLGGTVRRARSSSASRRMTRPASATRSRAWSPHIAPDEALELPVSVKLAHGRRA